ncbi:thioredoxin [Patescibacteria group bacterium]|nr:thioredoxin [Patescibacteria group bacterium]
MVELLDFYADWCGPCKIMEPIMEELEKEMGDKVKITKIDVDQKQEEASKYGVMSIPTYIILKDSKEVDRFIGATSKENVVQKLKPHLS